MEHTQIRRKLSAYLENAVNAGEKEEIKRHLESCGSCRIALANLELAVGRPNSLSEAKPPPWLTEKITAKRLAVAASQPNAWRRLFPALQAKLPLGAIALALLCVVGYYLTRTTAPQAPSTAPSKEIPRMPAAPPNPLTQPAPPPEAVYQSPPALPETSAALTETSAALPSRKRSAPPLPALPGQALSEPGLQPEDEEVAPEQTTEPVDEGWAAAAVAPEPEKTEIVLRVTDPAAASGAIEQAVGRLGGTIVGHASGGGGHFLAAQIGADKLTELTGRLGRIGTVRERPQLSAGAVGTVDLVIRW
jgi:Putative zinc-finger/Predicted integral membrane protein (DUF2275)